MWGGVQETAALTTQLTAAQASIADLSRAKAAAEEKLSAVAREKDAVAAESSQSAKSLRSEVEQLRVCACVHAYCAVLCCAGRV